MKKVGLISDTHIPSRKKNLPSSITRYFSDCDLILHAGDLEELKVIEDLANTAPVKAVHGNMCHSDVIRALPSILRIRIEEVTVGLIHGDGGPSGYYERIVSRFQRFSKEQLPDIIVCGHTHQPEAKIFHKIQFINPGSPTDKYFAPNNSIALMQIEKREFNFKFVDI
ncbi:metallophosphoesterase family protein [Candidatus Hodarchaeum mangrovi]